MPDLSTGSLDYQNIPVYDIGPEQFQLSLSTDFIDYVNLTPPVIVGPAVGPSSHPGKPNVL
mgnify:CR=1 FL=1